MPPAASHKAVVQRLVDEVMNAGRLDAVDDPVVSPQDQLAERE